MKYDTRLLTHHVLGGGLQLIHTLTAQHISWNRLFWQHQSYKLIAMNQRYTFRFIIRRHLAHHAPQEAKQHRGRAPFHTHRLTAATDG